MGVMSILDKLRTKPAESPKVEEEQVMEQPLIRVDENIKLQSQFMNLSGTPTKSRRK
jgi:hypothetical protein